jgi:hypothetical protein
VEQPWNDWEQVSGAQITFPCGVATIYRRLAQYTWLTWRCFRSRSEELIPLFGAFGHSGYRGKRSMVARFVAGWRKTGRTTRPHAPERISPKHAAILVTRGADQMTDEQQCLFDWVAGVQMQLLGRPVHALLPGRVDRHPP